MPITINKHKHKNGVPIFYKIYYDYVLLITLIPKHDMPHTYLSHSFVITTCLINSMFKILQEEKKPLSFMSIIMGRLI